MKIYLRMKRAMTSYLQGGSLTLYKENIERNRGLEFSSYITIHLYFTVCLNPNLPEKYTMVL